MQCPNNSGIEPQHISVTSRTNVRLINMLWPKHCSVILTFDILVLLRSKTTVVHFVAKTAEPANVKISSIVLTFSSVYNLCISQFQQCPSPPGNSGAFSRTFHPGDRALAFHPITPGHLTIPHSFTLQHCRFFFKMTISSANTVTFVLNTSR